MGAFFLVRSNAEDGHHLLERAQAHVEAQGFQSPVILSTEDYKLYLYNKLVVSVDNHVTQSDSDFCACTGTLLYRGSIGVTALKRFYDDFQPDSIPLEGLYGAFCVIIRKHARTFLLIDRLGIYKVYRNEKGTLWSSSFLAAAGALERRTVDAQSVYEYVFQGATYGNSTVFKEIRLADSGCVYELEAGAKEIPREGRLSAVASSESVDVRVDHNLKQLRDYFQVIGDCFGNNIDTALSGGYDSRLTLALLLERGIDPSLHVYGRESDADVRVARNISRCEGIDLVHEDKSRFPRVEADRFAEIVEYNFLIFDGYPTDGIFDNGADAATRRERCDKGRLMLNGGGGEIFRNFFYLRNRSFTVRQLMWTFYSRFDPRACTDRFDEHVYHSALGDKLKSAIGVKNERLTRQEVESAYPLFRCRYWMGRNNSVNNRFGYALTPFIDYAIVKSAISIPTQEKYFGRFEARLIRGVSPALAAYDSAYGHDFSGDVPWPKVIKEFATYVRPPRLRRYSYSVQNRLRKKNLPYTLTQNYLNRVLSDLPYMRAFFQVEYVRDPAQLNRICTLEYLMQRFPAEVVS